MKFFKFSLLLIAFFVGTASAAPTKEELVGMKKIVAYFPNWGVYDGHRRYFVKHIPFDKVTHVNFGFVGITEDGKLQVMDPWADLENPYGDKWGSKYTGSFGQLRKYKKKYPHFSNMLSVGGWSLSGNFHKVAETEAARKNFARNAVEFMQEHGFDGLDIDWEFPSIAREPDLQDNKNDMGTPNADANEKVEFTLLLKALREALDAAGNKDGRYYQLSAAVGGSEHHMSGVDASQYPQYLDMVNVMSYDFHGAWDKKTGHQSPLYPHPQLPKDGLTIFEAVNRLLDKGVPKHKIVVGSPFYSRGWSGVVDDGGITNKDGSPLPGLYGSAAGGVRGVWDGGAIAGSNPYYHIAANMLNKNGYKVYRDNFSKVPYLYHAGKKEFYTFEDKISLQERVNFVKDNGYGGIILWEISADMRKDLNETDPLIDVIYNGFYGN